LEENVPLAFGF